MTDAATLEALDNPTLFARRHELDREGLLASRLPTWAEAWMDAKADEFLDDMPALANDDDVLVALERTVAERLDECPGFVRHLCRRLVRSPRPSAAPVLRDLLARTSGPAASRAFRVSAGLAALACDPAQTLPVLLPEVGTPNETTASVCAVFVEHPKRAFDRLGDRLVVGATGDAHGRRGRLLAVLVADGIPDAAIARPASRRGGFLAADERWAAALLALAPEKTLFEAKRALANVAPEVLDGLRPKKKGKALPEARVVALGSVACEDLGAHAIVDVRGDLVMIATSPRCVTVRRLAEGLPLVADVVLPGGRRFATEAVGPYDSPYEAAGVHDAVLHPDGAAIALALLGEVLVVGLDGAIRAEVTLDDTNPHRLCFGPGGATLWVATNGDVGHTVTALDARTLAVLGQTKRLGEFPDPAWFTAHPHPTDDVGVFSILCGQDGAWVKVIERTAKGPAPRKQKLHASSGYAQVFGFHGNVAATGFGTKLTMRSWPELAATKSTKLEGECCGGVVVGEHVLVAIAEHADVPSRLVVHAMDGVRVAVAAWPAGHAIVERAAGALVTTSAGRVAVHRVELPASAATRARSPDAPRI